MISMVYFCSLKNSLFGIIYFSVFLMEIFYQHYYERPLDYGDGGKPNHEFHVLSLVAEGVHAEGAALFWAYRNGRRFDAAALADRGEE